jgi:branched-chain amino acid transport system substrate-binding protein
MSLKQAVAFSAALLAACSLIVVHGQVQCTVDGDCTARGFDAGSAKISCLNNVCVGPGVGGTCSTNAECTTRNGGQPAICRQDIKTCEALLSNECIKVYGDPSNDDAIILGGVFTLTGVNESSGSARMQSIELAIDDFTTTVVGLPGGSGGKPRPLVLVECDDASDNTTATNAVNHLLDVGVPAIIGPGGSGLVTQVVQVATIPAKTFLITPSATSTSLSGISPYVWRTAPSDDVQAIAMQDQVGAIETLYKTQNNVTKVSLAIAYQNNAYGTGLFGALTTGLSLNGAAVTDNTNDGFFDPVSYDATALDPSTAAAAVVTDKNNLVVGIGTTEIITKYLTPIETNWPSATPRPLYLFSDAGEKPELLTEVTGNTALRQRVRGTVPGTNNPLFGAFNIQYQGKYGALANVFGMAGAYDSLYLVAYAIVAIGNNPINGDSMSAAMSKMVGGTKSNVGAANIQSAFQVLQSGNAIDINGASGPLDFNLTLHEALSDITVWCISTDGSGNPVFAASGRYYDSPTQKMTGTFACP